MLGLGCVEKSSCLASAFSWENERFLSYSSLPSENVSCGVCSIHFYLLERLSNISIFSIIPELESCRDELLKMLVQAAYDIAGDIAMHHATSKVTDHLTTIICSVIEDMALVANGIQVELLDLMVCALCQDEKRKNQNGYALMRKVISSCPNNFQPFLERQLHQVVAHLVAHLRCRSAFQLAELKVARKKALFPRAA